MLSPISFWILLVFTFVSEQASIHDGFEVMPDTYRGGCSASQQNKLAAAFNEVLDMVSRISVAVNAMSDNEENISEGYIVSAMFAVPATEVLQIEGNTERTNWEIDTLLSIEELMRAILQHSRGELNLADLNGHYRKTRIYCSGQWLTPTQWRMDPETNSAIVPEAQLTQELYWDSVTNAYMRPPAELNGHLNVDTICGTGAVSAYTNTDFNAITFCPLMWNSYLGAPGQRPATIGEMPRPVADSDPGVHIYQFQSVSSAFLHEYTHLVGRGTGEIPNIRHQPEVYGFNAAYDLAENNPEAALENADSYAILGTALLLGHCDWRDGTNRSPQSFADRK